MVQIKMEKQINMESQNIRSKMIYRLESRRVSNFIDFQANFKNFKNIRNH